MSRRLTSKWTETAEQAFGESGRKGREGELLIIDWLRTRGSFEEIIDKENDRAAQLRGHDLVAVGNGREITIDVKCNFNSRHMFAVETMPSGWLYSKSPSLFIHVNAEHRYFIYYSPQVMREYLQKYPPSGELEWFNWKRIRNNQLGERYVVLS